MKSEKFKLLTNADGLQGQFNNEAFSNAIKNLSNKSKMEIKKGNKAGKCITQQSIMQQIADKAGFTYEAVQKWQKGHNGPSSYDVITCAAEILNVPESDLFTPIEDNQKGAHKMSNKEKELVDLMFGKCVEALYDHADKIFQEPDDTSYFGIRAKRSADNAEFMKKMNKLHLLIDQESLLINLEIADKLHNVLKILLDICDPGGSLVLDNIATIHIQGNQYDSVVEVRDLETLSNYCRTRKAGISYLGIWYIDYEIELAERYGCHNIKNVPESYYDNIGFDGEVYTADDVLITTEELMKYGCLESTYDDEPWITPKDIYIDQCLKLIRFVFKSDFPTITD